MGALAEKTRVLRAWHHPPQRQEDPVDMAHDVIGSEANDLYAAGLKNLCSLPVLSWFVSMDGAIDFHGEL
jgi:hypothetical protein